LTDATLLLLYLLILTFWLGRNLASLAAPFPVGDSSREHAALLRPALPTLTVGETRAEALIVRSLAATRSTVPLRWLPNIAAAVPGVWKPA